VTVNWSESYYNGDEIISYTVLIRTSDSGVYEMELATCDGSDSTIMDSQTCTIPVGTLIAAPFNLPWGTDVYVKIIATNAKGESDESNPGHGAIITTNPDAPINLAEKVSLRTSSTLGLTWAKGVNNGGGVIYDYTVFYKEQGGVYSTLESGVLTKYYTATGLTSGVTYVFKVQSRNSYGYSVDSDEFTVLSASIPDAPTAPTTTIDAAMAVISWSTPAINGSPITGYKIYIRRHD
jgi:hypothetical protein